MDTSDRPDSMLPARLSSTSPLPMPARAVGGLPTGYVREAPAAGPSMQISPTSILRGLARNWWKIAGLWLLLSAPILFLIYTQVKPTYVAYSNIEIKQAQPALFRPSAVSTAARDKSIQNEINKIRTDRVLDQALAAEGIADLPFVKESESPRTKLMERLVIVNPKDTDFIKVSLESPNAKEAADIVNAVVTSYVTHRKASGSGEDKTLINSMTQYLDSELVANRVKIEKELETLMETGAASSPIASTTNKSSTGTNEVDDARPRNTNDVSIEQFRKYKDEHHQKSMELYTARAMLEQRTADFQNSGEVEETAVANETLSEQELAQRIESEFLADPAIMDLYDQARDVKERLEHVQRGTRKASDPSRTVHKEALARLEDRIKEYWVDRQPLIRERILASLGDRQTKPTDPKDASTKTLEELRAEVKRLEIEQAAIAAVLEKVDVEKQKSTSASYKAQFLQAQIETYRLDEQLVRRQLEDLKFRSSEDVVRIAFDPATEPKIASDGKRIKLMAAVPVGVLVLVLGIFSLLEVKAERVGDPDMLSSRVQSEVYSLPPIPMGRSAQRRLGTPGDDDHIDRFIQRLDHLRFAVCGDHPEVGLGRCVLISSAVGSEGKTTLAAQLAARCGHAGHTTLLIDADIRRGALSPLLDVPEGQGLSDVLMKDDLNVEDVVIPVQGGTFHLLSAGSPTSDTSRVFQGRSFGMLIARLRQLYDLIIIDSPPILPDPDALIMGRWTDGVVLASRYDVSRAPQVERARRQLDLAGIPVLGTVINGMRTSDAYYGRYTYNRQRNEEASRESPADAASSS